MPDLLIYLLGLVTLPGMCGLLLLSIKLFMPDGFLSRQCGACDWEQHESVPVVRWLRWKAHRIWGQVQPWHRQSLAILYLERGADPISGKPLGREFAVHGAGATSLTNMRIEGDA